jgi:hypothetical protein
MNRRGFLAGLFGAAAVAADPERAAVDAWAEADLDTQSRFIQFLLCCRDLRPDGVSSCHPTHDGWAFITQVE